MIKVFFDTNILVTALLSLLPNPQTDREMVELCKKLWQAAKDRRIAGYVAAFALPTIFSLAESEFKDKYRRAGWHWQPAERQARRDAYNIVKQCTETLNIAELYLDDIEAVEDLMNKELVCNDFEDNLQLACASGEEVFTLVTLNKRDFGCAVKFGITVVTPTQLLTKLGLS